ncbi:hypothetical protein JMJ55_26230 [Belnapia sp. T6]|uniref:Uncharacterized protein n=1 Tax=Belnapia mucosa TaxID=2804532 RepID=A0ABS1VAY0_9PROT|nr:hypothetical protein [Belnapia mucosa]MBL6458834.1 hypothetical protein [Belnapia mucosa]
MARTTHTTPSPGGDTPAVLARRGILASLGVLAAGAADAAAGLSAPVEADAKLLTLCTELTRHQAETIGLEAPYYTVVAGPPEELHAMLDERDGRYHDLIEAIYVLPARTIEGLQAKARIVLALTDNKGRPLGPDDRVPWSLARDLLDSWIP